MTKRKKMLFTLVTCILFLLLAEAGMRLCYWTTGRTPPTPQRSRENEWQWVQNHLSAGTWELKSELRYDRSLGWRNASNIDTAELRTNSQGMRDLREFSTTKNKRRLLFVGDSYTFGHRVSNEETFAWILEHQYLSDWEILNMAVPGTGTDQHLLMFETVGKKYSPDVVVLGFFVRDYSRNLLSFREYAKPYFQLIDGTLRLRNCPVVSPEELYTQYSTGERQLGVWYQSYLINEIWRGYNRFDRNSIDATSEGWLLLAELMRLFQEVVQRAGAKSVFLIIPSRDIFSPEGSRYQSLEVLCEKRCEALAMPCLRLDGYFVEAQRQNPQLRIYRPKSQGGHLSPDGHALVARVLHEFLVQNKILE